MPGLLDLALPGGYEAPNPQDAAMRGLLGFATGLGRASGPSPVPLNFGNIAAIAGDAGLGAYDNAERGQLQRGLLGAQIGKLTTDQQAKAQAQQLLSMRDLPDTPQVRMILSSAGYDPDKILALRKFGYNGTSIDPNYLESQIKEEGGKSAVRTHIVPTASGGVVGYGPGFGPGGFQGMLQNFYQGGGFNQGGQPLPPAARGVGPQSNAGTISGSSSDSTLIGGAGNDALAGGTQAPASPGVQMAQAQPNSPYLKQLLPPAVQPGQAFGVQQKPVESFGDEKGKVYGKAFGGIREGADKASAMEGNLAFMRNLDVMGGALTPFLAGLGSIAQSVGVSPETVKRLTNVNVGDAQAFDASSKELVYNMLGSLGTGVSNVDRDFVEKIVPTLRTTPGAAEKLFDYMQAKIDWNKARWQNAFDADMSQGGKDVYAPLKADADWKKKNPFPEFMKQYPSLQTAPVQAEPVAPAATPQTAPQSAPEVPRTTTGGIDSLRLQDGSTYTLDGKTVTYDAKRKGFVVKKAD